MQFEKTPGFVEGTDIPIYFHEKVGNYVKGSDIPHEISKHLRGVTCIMNNNGETMVPVRDIEDIIRYGYVTD